MALAAELDELVEVVLAECRLLASVSDMPGVLDFGPKFMLIYRIRLEGTVALLDRVQNDLADELRRNKR